MPPNFQEFIAVDWSGAKGPRLPGLQVAVCRPGRSAPGLEQRRPSWTREGVLAFVIETARARGPVLAGFDFGFAYPFMDEGGYFPGLRDRPATAPALWAMIDRLAVDAPDLYGGVAVRPPSSLARLFNAPGHRGTRFDNRRLRVTERRCPTRPSCMFNGVGPGAVGIGSLAGMRMLHRLKKVKGIRVAVWPFDPVDGADLVVVEIFPRLYAKLAGEDPRAWRGTRFLEKVCRCLGSDDSKRPVRSEDEVDALLSAAALRYFSRMPAVWCAPGAEARAEGWIFGVT